MIITIIIIIIITTTKEIANYKFRFDLNLQSKEIEKENRREEEKQQQRKGGRRKFLRNFVKRIIRTRD